MRLLLIRHGQTPANVDGILDAASPGPSLTDLGEQQAEALPGALASERIQAIWVSILRRTGLTAAPLVAATGIEPQTLPGVEEIGAGTLQGSKDQPSIQTYIGVVRGWAGGELDGRIPGGENGHEFFARFDAAIQRVADSADSAARQEDVTTAVVFSHGAAIRTWTAARATNAEPALPVFAHLDNTGIVVLEGDPRTGWELLTWNSEPLGGPQLADSAASDPAGEAG